ncbi:hypothetical protein GPJ56_009602 [Histomonas meleagridis]|uniref:uncharacterized protein n=1 Tax=Histomonas meleagridis TaxID=135588 RepID=UPI0035596059|nr:hypothetical protein GPJ56_009602 [Histomonas meleagridis]KAH0799631.1 hypothetical protein GO595_007545 [Histomonas meleagridis]
MEEKNIFGEKPNKEEIKVEDEAEIKTEKKNEEETVDSSEDDDEILDILQNMRSYIDQIIQKRSSRKSKQSPCDKQKETSDKEEKPCKKGHRKHFESDSSSSESGDERPCKRKHFESSSSDDESSESDKERPPRHFHDKMWGHRCCKDPCFKKCSMPPPWLMRKRFLRRFGMMPPPPPWHFCKHMMPPPPPPRFMRGRCCRKEMKHMKYGKHMPPPPPPPPPPLPPQDPYYDMFYQQNDFMQPGYEMQPQFWQPPMW